MKTCPSIVRLVAAAGLYLLVMWGYMTLPSGQWFAVFLALLMCAMLIFWVTEAAADSKVEHALLTQTAVDAEINEASCSQPPLSEPSLDAAVLRLDSLKSELTTQYAQFGRDQSLINSNGLGSWHSTRNPRTR